MSIFFFPACSRAFRDAPHLRFRCRDPNHCLPKFFKMLLLAYPQIHPRVFYLWKSVALGNASDKDSRAFISFLHSTVFARLTMRHTRVFFVSGSQTMLCIKRLLKMLVLALPQIYTSVFNLWKSINLDSASVRYSFPC